MKVIWEEEDIIVGRKFKLPIANETWIIGYIPSCAGKEKYVNISLCDGMVTTPISAEWMASILTDAGYLPIELC